MKNGFTFIELIIVITFIAILSSIGIASFVNYSKTQNLESARSNLLSVFNLAKSRAMSQTKPPSCTELNGYEVVITRAGNKYDLYPICSNLRASSVVSASLPSGVTFNSSIGSSSVSFFFPVIVSGVKIKVDDVEISVAPKTIKLNSYDLSNTIVIDKVGGISAP